ncbi:uncharacterized protein LOC143218542 [Lasioglossum baleicum]|uniref:uncharacterized protein LOC143218542 n=1 Tax=Lasioglossum baleicum TaxID=434251 RepID=UPI003FCD71F4
MSMKLSITWLSFRLKPHCLEMPFIFLIIQLLESPAQPRKIVWRAHTEKTPLSYHLHTVTYGLASAPYLAIRTLHQLATDEGNRFPLATEIIQREIYVDDVLSGADTILKASTENQASCPLTADSAPTLRSPWPTPRDLHTASTPLVADAFAGCTLLVADALGARIPLPRRLWLTPLPREIRTTIINSVYLTTPVVSHSWPKNSRRPTEPAVSPDLYPLQAQEKIRQVDECLKSGCFILKKWTASDEKLLKHIPLENRQHTSPVSLETEQFFNVLGILWHPKSDSFAFTSCNTPAQSRTTKRTVLSRVPQLFDPLGWIAPVVVRGKIFIQKLWSAKLSWDEPIPQELMSQWNRFEEDLKDISSISVARWLGYSASSSVVELHGFSDASQSALGAVIYLRVITDLNDARVTLVTAKTRVAPLNKVTVPRLELSAALLLVRHMSIIRKTLDLEKVPIYLWMDSTVALAYIRGDARRWADFVQSRVTEIQELSNCQWRHISGTDNPADCASRGLSPTELREHALWWNGPAWLSKHSTHWPRSTPSLDPDIALEFRKVPVTIANKDEHPVVWNLVDRFASLRTLLRITAWCFRALEKFRRNKGAADQSSSLTPEELNHARLFWVKLTQTAFFKVEINQLRSDCGTNFIGADKELRNLFQASSKEAAALANILANDGTRWKFNPPSSPHFGGKWEAAVKSVKFHLKRVIGDTDLTYEEFSTLLSQIKAILNSRPLCPLSDDPTDPSALTPGHFLIGTALTTTPEPAIIDLPNSRLSRWQLLRQMLERFWIRWSAEYLQHLQTISQWQRRSDAFKIGSLELVADERYPPSKWALGRIIDVHPGQDNLVRVATVVTDIGREIMPAQSVVESSSATNEIQ